MRSSPSPVGDVAPTAPRRRSGWGSCASACIVDGITLGVGKRTVEGNDGQWEKDGRGRRRSKGMTVEGNVVAGPVPISGGIASIENRPRETRARLSEGTGGKCRVTEAQLGG